MNELDKEEFRIKLEEINKLVQDKDYKGAMNIVDSIDWRRVKNVRTLCVVGEIYAANGRYEDSKEIFLLAYHKASIGKNILYRLIEISLRMDDINEAEEFFEEYKQVASNDSTQYILQYKIARAKNSSLNEQNLQRNGHMNWQLCITKQEKNRNVWIYAMKSFSGSVKANML